MRVFKQTYRDKSGKSRKTKKWYVEFRDHDQQVRRWPAFTDKARANELGRKLEGLVRCRITGEHPDPDIAVWLESLPKGLRTKLAEADLLDGATLANSRPLAEHLADFRKAVAAKGNTSRHVDTVVGRAERLFNACGFAGWSDIDADRIVNHLQKRQETTKKRKGISAQTYNTYVQAAGQFCRWMVRERRATRNPVAHIAKLNVKADRRYERRAFAVDELRMLIATAEHGPERFGMLGAERALLYHLAVETGLRVGELRSLKRSSFELFANQPIVRVAAAYSKQRDDNVIPLRRTLAGRMLAYLDTKHPNAPAFAVPPSYDTAAMLRADLADARATWLEDATDAKERKRRTESDFLCESDHAGRKADFHALRHTFITNLAAGNVHPKTAQALARHSTITLTMDRYTHSMRDDEAEALDVLPDLFGPLPIREAATGTTDVKSGDENWASNWASHVRKHEISGDGMRQNNAVASDDITLESKGFDALSPGESGKPPVGLEPTTCALQKRCSAN